VEAAQGSELQKQLKPGQRLVTKEGDLWRWDGFTAAADAPTAAAKRLEQRNRLADLEEEIAEQKALARAARDTFEAARLAAQEAQAKEQELRRALRDAQSHESQLRAELTAAERQASAQLSRLAALAEAEERLSGDLTEARRTHEESTASLEGLRPDGELKEKVAAKREEVGALRIELSEARAALESINREAQARARRLSVIGQERSAWELRSANARKQIETLGQRKQEAEAELEELKDVPGAIEEKRKSLLSFISQAETERREAADALAEAERHLSEIEAMIISLADTRNAPASTGWWTAPASARPRPKRASARN